MSRKKGINRKKGFFIYLNMPLRHALLASFLPSAQTMHESLFTGYFLFHFVLKSS